MVDHGRRLTDARRASARVRWSSLAVVEGDEGDAEVSEDERWWRGGATMAKSGGGSSSSRERRRSRESSGAREKGGV
jgi:hypothetical protein